MDTLQQLVTVTTQTFAACANIFLIAKSVGLPLKNSEMLIRSSPYSVFFFVMMYAISNTTSVLPAVLGTVLYFYFEFEDLNKPSRGDIEAKFDDSVQSVKKKYQTTTM